MDAHITDQKWYEKTWVIVLFLIFFWPVGLFLMWRFADWSKVAKVVVTIIIVGCVVLWIMMIVLGSILFMKAPSIAESGSGELTETREETSNLDNLEDENNGVEEDSTDRFARMKDVKLYFDDRDWKLGYQDEQMGNIIMEFVLEGETVHTRSEMVTAQFLGTMAGASPRKFADEMEEKLKQSVDGDLDWDIFNEQNDELMYEFILQNDSMHADQHEVARVIAAEDGLFVLHYMIEEAPMSSEKHKLWTDLLLKAEVK